jgi:hypothetical protein
LSQGHKHAVTQTVLSNQPTNSHLCFIIHANKPYCFDFNDILALPSGFKYRNRFDIQWVDPVLRDRIEEVVGQQVLLTLRDASNNRLVPARWGRVITAERYGRIAFFEYILGDLIEYGNDENVQTQQIISHTKTFSDNHAWLPGTPNQGLSKPSVFKTNVGPGIPTADADDRKAWGNVVSAVASAPIYHKIEFLKVMGVYGSDDKPARIEDQAFVLEPDSVYNIRVIQFVPAPGPPGQDTITPHPIELTTFREHIIALRPKQQAVGKYDRLTFTIRVGSLRSNERTAIEIPHVPDAAVQGNHLTSLYLPVRIKQSQGVRAVVALAILAVALFFMFRPALGSIPPDVVRNIATVIFVLTLSGPSQTLSALWPSLPWRVS